MMKRIGLARLMALVMTLAMVLSAASPALACTSSETTVYYYKTASETAYKTYDVTMNNGTSGTANHTLQAAPERSGYTFTGFNVYVGSKTGTLFKSNAAVGSTVSIPLTRASTSKSWPTIHIVAQWKSDCVTYDVTFKTVLVDGKGGQIGKTSSTLGYADIAYLKNSPSSAFPAIPVTDPDQAYVFLGWYTYDGSTYTKVTTWPSKVDKNYTFYARWEAKPYVERSVYTLHYIGKPSDMTGVIWPADVDKQAAPVLTLGTASKVGASFDGWKLNGAGANLMTLVAENYTKSAAEPVITYDAATDSYIRTTEYIANVHGSFAALQDIIEKYYSVTYKVDLNLDGDYADAGETTLAHVDVASMPTTVNAGISQDGYTFAGWFKQGSSTKLTTLVFANYDLDAGRTQTIPAGPGTAKIIKNYYSITLTGTLTKQVCAKTDYTVLYTGESAGATFWPSNVYNASSAPSIAADATKNGYTFNGWSPASLNWSAGYVNVVVDPEYYDAGLKKFVTLTHKTITVNGTFTKCEDVVEKYFSVTYKIDLNLDGDYADAGEIVNAYVEAAPMPTTVNAGISQDGYTFAGWFKQGTTVKLTALAFGNYDFDRTVTVPGGVGAPNVIKNYYKITLTGTLTKQVCAKTFYSVNYTGDKDIATTWPNDVANVESAPTLAADATKNGYDFSGWKIGGSPVSAFNWNASYVVVTSQPEVYDPVSGIFITKIYRTITVEGRFVKCEDIEKKFYTVEYWVTRDGTAEKTEMLGYSVTDVTSMPTGVAGSPIIPNGYSFGGWDQTPPLEQGDFSIISEGTVPSTQPGVGAVHTIRYKLAINGALSKNILSVEEYIVDYHVTNNTGATIGAYDAQQRGSTPLSAQALPTVPPGYSIKGWGVTLGQPDEFYGEGQMLPWGNSAATFEEKLEKRDGVWVFVQYSRYMLGASATVTENEHGQATEYSLSYGIAGGPYTDPTDGAILSASNMPANVVASPTMPALGGSPSMKGHTFGGWAQGGSAIGASADIVWTLSTRQDFDSAHNRTIDVTIYTAHLTGSFARNMGEEEALYNLSYSFANEPYQAPHGINLTINNRPADVTGAAAKPALAGAPSVQGHTFTGWKQSGSAVDDATLNWGSAAVSYRYDEAADRFIKVLTYSAAVVGDFTMNCGEETIYNLTYVIAGQPYKDLEGRNLTIGNPPANVSGSASKPSLAGNPTLDGHSFSGWTQNGAGVSDATLDWGTAGINYRYDDVGDRYITIRVYSAEVTGSFTMNDIVEKELWNLTYTGDKDLADPGTWPNDLADQTSEPALTTLTPAKLGYAFEGWKQNGAPAADIGWAAVLGYTLNSDNRFVKTTVYSATIEGRLVKKGCINEYVYIVDYTVHGGSSSYDHLDVNVTNPPSLPTIAPEPSEDGKLFGGWNPGSLDWDGTPAVEGETRFDETLDQWVTTYTKKIDVTGSFGKIEHVYIYELTFTGPAGAVLPDMKSGTSAQTIGDETASLDGHRFTGWSPASISGSDYAENGSRLEISPDGLIYTHYLEASTVAQFIPINEREHYTLHYAILGSVPGQPANPPDEEGASPISPSAVVSLDGYNFSGWSAPAWEKTGETSEIVDGVEIITTLYEGTAYGSFTGMEIVEEARYTLLYQGYVSGVTNWPGDVVDSLTPPELAGAPYLPGYIFKGWRPNTLDWSTAAVSVSTQIVTPTEGEPYILKTTTYTLAVTAKFVKEGGPDPTPDPSPTPTKPPLGTPQTGNTGLIIFVAAFALIAVIFTASLFIRKKVRAIEEED